MLLCTRTCSLVCKTPMCLWHVMNSVRCLSSSAQVPVFFGGVFSSVTTKGAKGDLSHRRLTQRPPRKETS